MAKIASSEVEEEETEAVEVGEAEEVAEEEAIVEAKEEEAVEEVEEVAPEVPEKKVEEKPRHTPLGKSRVIERATKEDFMEFARKFYPTLVEEFEAERIPFEELKTRVERDVGLVWVDLKE